MKNKDWIEEFYEALEKTLTNYTRPADYRERMQQAQNRIYKPVRNQREGRRTDPGEV